MALAAYVGLIAPVAAKDGDLGANGAAGVTVGSSPFRYVTISPRRSPRLTVVERVELAGGRVNRWWYLRGGWQLPAVAYDGSAGGLSADEGTLVLSAISNGDHGRQPVRTRLAVLDTELHLRHPARPGATTPDHAVTRISLPGELPFDAVSPDGSVAYLTQYLRGTPATDDFRVVAVSTATGRWLRGPFEPEGEAPMSGVPVTRVYSRDGRWSYALYYGDAREPFVQALDTGGRRVSRIELPHLHPGRDPFGLRLRLSGDGRSLIVFHRTSGQGGRSPVLATVSVPIDVSSEPAPRREGPLDFLFTPRRPGNLLVRAGIAGHSAAGRAIWVRQWGDPVRPAVLVIGCIHGDECAARKLEPRFVLSGGCPDPSANLVLVRDLNPDGRAARTRTNGDGVDLNRNFPAGWRRIGSPGDPQYSGPQPFSEPESRLAARIVRTVDPTVTIWFHQHRRPGAFVRGWGQSAPTGRRFAYLAGIPFRLLPWPDGTAPNWQNHGFPGASSFVVEMPPGPLALGLEQRLGEALGRLAHRVGEDGHVARGGRG